MRIGPRVSGEKVRRRTSLPVTRWREKYVRRRLEVRGTRRRLPATARREGAGVRKLLRLAPLGARFYRMGASRASPLPAPAARRESERSYTSATCSRTIGQDERKGRKG